MSAVKSSKTATAEIYPIFGTHSYELRAGYRGKFVGGITTRFHPTQDDLIDFEQGLVNRGFTHYKLHGKKVPL